METTGAALWSARCGGLLSPRREFRNGHGERVAETTRGWLAVREQWYRLKWVGFGRGRTLRLDAPCGTIATASCPRLHYWQVQSGGSVQYFVFRSDGRSAEARDGDRVVGVILLSTLRSGNPDLVDLPTLPEHLRPFAYVFFRVLVEQAEVAQVDALFPE